VQVIFTPLAERQLDKLHREITLRSGFESRADAYIERIVDYCLGLDLFPQRGAARDDLLLGLRVLGFERRATIAFVITADRIVIEGVYYGGQDLDANFSTAQLLAIVMPIDVRVAHYSARGLARCAVGPVS
jgi:toxin ParE1/3/4